MTQVIKYTASTIYRNNRLADILRKKREIRPVN